MQGKQERSESAVKVHVSGVCAAQAECCRGDAAPWHCRHRLVTTLPKGDSHALLHCKFMYELCMKKHECNHYIRDQFNLAFYNYAG